MDSWDDSLDQGERLLWTGRPDTHPAIDTPETLEFVTRRAADAPVNIRHMAALTRARDGREMVEMSFLQDVGAIAFTVGKYGIAALTPLADLMLSFYLTCLLFVFVVLGLIAAICGGLWVRFKRIGWL